MWGNAKCWLCSASVAIGVKINGVSLMSIDHPTSEQPCAAANPKKPYEKPAFRHEQVFVTTALSCGKVGSGTSACSIHSSAS